MPFASLARIGRRLYDAPYILLSCTALLWASNIVLGRFVAGHIPPLTLACLRWFLATLIILPFAWRQIVADRRVIARNLPLLLVLGAAGIASFNAMSYYGLQYTLALNGLLVQSISPLLIALWSPRPVSRQALARPDHRHLHLAAGRAGHRQRRRSRYSAAL